MPAEKSLNKDSKNTVLTATELYEKNDKLVHHSYKYLHLPYSHPHYEDILQEGRIGLWKACERFNPDRGTAFSSYAISMILGYMRRYIREKGDFGGKLPRKLIDARYQYLQLKGQDSRLTDEEICQELKISLVDLAIITHPPTSLDALLTGDSDPENITKLDTVTDNSLEDTLDNLALDEILDRLESYYFNNPLHRQIFLEYTYSKIFDGEFKQQSIASKYNISQSYVSRIISICKDKLRRYLDL